MRRKLFALSLSLLIMAGTLAGCTSPQAETTPAPQPVESPAVTLPPESEPPAEGGTVRFAVLKGPSGVGAAKLIADNEEGITENRYDVSLLAANDEVAAGLTNGSIDIAALASNVAANLYNKTGGDIQVVAVSGLGVLYILENGDSVHSMADLEGQTLYATGQGANPEYVLNYLLTENGVEPSQVDIQWKTADEITALMASGEGQLCMLPVPAATGVMMKNTDVREALDLSAEWDDLSNGSRLTMTTLVVRREFAERNPQAVEQFLKDYMSSVEFMIDPTNTLLTDIPTPAELTAEYGLTPNAQIAEAAIPKCALTYITGANEVRKTIQGYYEVLFQANPQSIGGSIPDDGFYYGG